MRLCVIQMDMRLGESAYNFAHAEALLRRAAAEGADTALLPEKIGRASCRERVFRAV